LKQARISPAFVLRIAALFFSFFLSPRPFVEPWKGYSSAFLGFTNGNNPHLPNSASGVQSGLFSSTMRERLSPCCHQETEKLF